MQSNKGRSRPEVTAFYYISKSYQKRFKGLESGFFSKRRKNMNEEKNKLEKIKKSSKIAVVVSRILFITAAVACTLCLISGIVLLANREKYDNELEANRDSFNGTYSIAVGNMKLAEIDEGELQTLAGGKLESSVPSLEKFFEENSNSIALHIGFYLIAAAVAAGLVAFCLWLFSSVFSIIQKEDNPFCDKVIKRTLISMIIFCILLAFTAGGGFAALGAVATWVIYTILDYGKTLQVLSDETL